MNDPDAWRRAYLGHGDQLGALEAEAARDARRTLPRRAAAVGIVGATVVGVVAVLVVFAVLMLLFGPGPG